MQQFQIPNRSPRSLLEAAAFGDLAAVRRFLAQRANPHQQDADGWTALHHAVGYGQAAGIDVPTDRTPNNAVVTELIRAGVPLNAVSKSGWTALMEAVATRHEEAARLLVEAGTDLRPTDSVGGTALTLAVWFRGPSPFAQYLVTKGAPVNLWDALWLGDTSRALALLPNANLRTKGPRGYTYLHLAALLGNRRVVDALLARKADVNARAAENETPLHLAIGGTLQGILPGGEPTISALYGSSTGREELIRRLIQAGAKVDARGKRGAHRAGEFTPLGCAILAAKPNLAQVLLQAGANPNQKGGTGDPILFDVLGLRGSDKARVELTKLLLAAGANPRVKSDYGTTALEYVKDNPALRKLIQEALKKPSRKR